VRLQAGRWAVVLHACSAAALLGCGIAVCLCNTYAQDVYVDEPALLSGLAAPVLQRVALPVAPFGAEARRRWLLERLADFEPVEHLYPVAPSRNCSCAATSATVRARRSDGSEELLLSIHGDCGGAGTASGMRAAALMVTLVTQLARAPWLAKDVRFFAPACCSCAHTGGGGGGAAGCSAAPLRHYLRELHGLAPDGGATIKGFGTSARLTQTIALELCPRLLSPQRGQDVLPMPVEAVADASCGASEGARVDMKAADVTEAPKVAEAQAAAAENAARAAVVQDAVVRDALVRDADSLCVRLFGVRGRVPNLDSYAAVWRAAQRPELRVPLRMELGWGEMHTVGGLIGGLIGGLSTRGGLIRLGDWLGDVLPALLPALRPAAAVSSALVQLSWGGAEDAPHAEALDLGIDALSLRLDYTHRRGGDGRGYGHSGGVGGGGAGSGGPDGGLRPPHRPPLSDGQLLGLLELSVRSFSNLHESLHHSHYVYLPISADRFIALKWAAPLLLLPPLTALLLQAAAHLAAAEAFLGDSTGAVHREGRGGAGVGGGIHSSLVAAMLAVIVTHLACALPCLAEHGGLGLRALSLLSTPASLLLLIQLGWLVLVATLFSALNYNAFSPASLAAAASAAAALVAATLSASSLALGIVSAVWLCTLGLVVVPFSAPKPHSWGGHSWAPTLSGRSRQRLILLVDTLAFVAVSPLSAACCGGTLLEAINGASSHLSPVSHALALVEASQRLEPGGLQRGFVCFGHLPLSAVAAALLLSRLVHGARRCG